MHGSLSEITQVQATLASPRILCLHGGGTNATIFRAQCRQLEKSLTPMFRLCYVQAPFPCEPGSDVTSVYSDFAPFRGWLDPQEEVPNLAGAIEESQNAMAADNEKGATGDWVALLGFSQGAKICASLLYHQQQLQSKPALMLGQQTRSRICSLLHNFRFAVLLAGRGPFVSLTEPPQPGCGGPRYHTTEEKLTTIMTPRRSGILDVPTIHVHGLKDPGLPIHRQFLDEYFDPRSARLIEWDGEHRVPIKTKDLALVVEAIVSLAKETGVSCCA